MSTQAHTQLPALYPACIMTPESVAAYVQWEQSRGATTTALRRCRRFTASLYDWLPADKAITKDLLLQWRQWLGELGYSPDTERNYVKGINRYLDYAGRSDLRFRQGRAKDIAGQQFGYLTAIEPTGAKERKDIVWRCRCKCGSEVEYPATRLLTGNTLSCGCLRREHLQEVNRYCDGTSIRMAMTEQVHSTRAESGYTGVTRKRDKWKAYINYKGQHMTLGCYPVLEDAVRARARGKELVQQDALELQAVYEAQHEKDPPRPDRTQIRARREETPPQVPERSGTPARRSDNTSGCPGVFRRRGKWAAKITYQKITYPLGTFTALEEAVAARQEAEQLLQAAPQQFREKYRKQEILATCKK